MDRDGLTDGERSFGNDEQGRLSEHWRTELGLVRLPNDPAFLRHTSCINKPILEILALWA